MKDYEISEQLFEDVWKKHGSLEEIEDGEVICQVLNDLVTLSKHAIVLDHYSHINFDEIIKVEYDKDNDIFKIYWQDNDNYRIAMQKKELGEMEQLSWAMSGFCTYYYLAVKIDKIKFVKVESHIFVLIRGDMTTEKDMQKVIIGSNEVIDIENCTSELYARYVYWEGNKKDMKKVECIANNLPYYVCVIQPKENIPSTVFSKKLLLENTLQEVKNRLKKVKISLQNDNIDRDELFSKGNTIRIVMEYALKHFCVLKNIPIEIEQKYGHIKLGDLKKKIKNHFEIKQNIINMANELSHDSGKKYKKNEVIQFGDEVELLIEELQMIILDTEDDR